MYRNIGRKIKGLSIALAVIGMVFFVLNGLAVAFAWESVQSSLSFTVNGQPLVMEKGTRIIVGAVIAVVGVLACWIGSWFTYGIGTLIDNTSVIAKNTDSIRRYTKNS